MIDGARSRWTPGRGLAVSSLFLAAFALAGLRPAGAVVGYSVFGLVDGLVALLLVYVLAKGEVLRWSGDLWGVITLGYATGATAQLLGALLPPPGVLQWLGLALVVAFAWAARYGGARSRLVVHLGLLALGLATFRYAVLPFVWRSTQLPATPVLDLRALGESVKGLFQSYTVAGPAQELCVFLGVVAWVSAVWVGWPPEGGGTWVRRLSRSERDRLLFWLLTERSLTGEEVVRGYLDRAEDAE